MPRSNERDIHFNYSALAGLIATGTGKFVRLRLLEFTCTGGRYSQRQQHFQFSTFTVE